MNHRHPLFARWYARTSLLMERGIAVHRAKLLAGLSGKVIEVGAGNGLNFRHYPSTVAEVVAVEPEPYLRELAVAAAERAPVPVRVVAGTADRLSAAESEFDGGVASLVLCSVPDQAVALTELRRAIRPGGELRFFEHVRADTPRWRGCSGWSTRCGRCSEAAATPAVTRWARSGRPGS